MAATTQIGPGTYVELTYTLFDEDGDVIEKAEAGEPLSYVHGFGQIVPGLERGIEGMQTGQTREVKVLAADGYGDHDPEGVFEVDKADFPNADAVKLEDEFVAEGPDGSHVPMRVIDILEDSFMVDTNHPLAGQNLRFELTVGAVRPATAEEIAEAEAELEEHDHDGCCDHDHDHPHDHAHPHDHGHSHDGGSLVQLGTKPKQEPS